ncbi:MAG: DUF1538 domain-containing protein [Oscillospiraceae bacterium]|nr:DUF1538 domain-containing protein [Oscillospiraceae bacterium]
MELRKKLAATTREALFSVLPITVIVFLLTIFIAPMNAGTLLLFLLGAILLVFGMGLFTLGADMSLMPLGEDVGIKMTTTKRLAVVILVSFLMGGIITVAEPDLQVLAALVPGIENVLLILTVAGGVGLFLIVAVLRIIFKISLARILIVCYALAFVLSALAPVSIRSVAFDAGGVTTGPITVPFIMAMGIGLASIRGDRESLDDSFGLVALGSLGPILAVLLLGIFFHPTPQPFRPWPVPEIQTSRDAVLEFIRGIPVYAREMAAAVWPILAVLAAFQLVTRRYRAARLLRMLIGFAYTLAGLILFMTGVNIGFIPIGQSLGAEIASSPLAWLLVPLGAVIGYFIVAAEPAVHVLKRQVEEISLGTIPGARVMRYLSVGVSISLALSMVRVLTGVSLYWFLVPGYLTALVLTFFVPKIFTGIAFDSGGVVSGPMTTTFLLPFVIGACRDPSRIMTDAFGIVAMIAMTPLIAIQLMGVLYKKRLGETAAPAIETDDGIAYFEEETEGEENDDERG